MKIYIDDVTLFFDVDVEALVPDGAVMREKLTLLLLHGGPGSTTVVSSLSFHGSRILLRLCLDHRGMGRSERGDTSKWMLERWVRDVKEFCDKLGVEKPVVLGHSFGGFVAAKYASMYPDHPSKLIVSGSLANSILMYPPTGSGNLEENLSQNCSGKSLWIWNSVRL